MRKSRFTESQIVGILKQGEAGVPIAEILRQHNIRKATYFHSRSKYAGASVDELKRLRELEAENAKLKRMDAELALENAAESGDAVCETRGPGRAGAGARGARAARMPGDEALAGGVLPASAVPAAPGRRCRDGVERGGRPAQSVGVLEVFLSPVQAYLFDSLEQVRDITEAWLEIYNTERPHEQPSARCRPWRFCRGQTPP
jgi:putative transposase